MASLLFKEIKGMRFSCSSPSSTAICTNINQHSVLKPNTVKEIFASNQHTHQQIKETKKGKPLSSHLSQPSSKTIKSRNSRRSLDCSSRFLLEDDAFIDVLPDEESIDILNLPSSKGNGLVRHRHSVSGSGNYVCMNRCKSPVVMTELLPIEYSRFRSMENSSVLNRPCSARQTPRSTKSLGTFQSPLVMPCSSTRQQQDQVVELRVSIHCKGCEGKVRKQISKMEGVKSFSVDLAKKKVTVVGDVTPLGVLNGISKVKNCQFWSSPPRTSASF